MKTTVIIYVIKVLQWVINLCVGQATVEQLYQLHPKAFHAKMGTKKDRKSKDPTEAEDIKKRWQEHKGRLYKKIPCCPR